MTLILGFLAVLFIITATVVARQRDNLQIKLRAMEQWVASERQVPIEFVRNAFELWYITTQTKDGS